MQFKPDCAVIFSGGLDSTTLVYDLVNKGHEPHLLSFNYGQRHARELEYATTTAFKLGLRHDVVDLTGITHLISNSALTSPKWHNTQGVMPEREIEVPEGHYAEDTMKATVVPNRNMIMLSIAAGVAVNNNYDFIATGVHAGDHFVYPDCRPQFIDAVNAAIVHGNIGFGQVAFAQEAEGVVPASFIQTPFLFWSKTDIAIKAFQLELPLEDTWSCYKGGEKHCGKCGTCVERLEAIHEASLNLHGERAANNGIFDNTDYEDKNFWRQAIASR